MLRANEPMMDAAGGARPGAMPASEPAAATNWSDGGDLHRQAADFRRPRLPGALPVLAAGAVGNIGVKPAVTLNCQVTLAFANG